MTDKQFPSSQTTNEVAVQQSRAARWIEDPFASVIAGIIVPTFAVVLLLSSMAGLSSLLAA
jgi:hypothetical protein